MARIAFIGLGNMGGPMAANLLRAGDAVTGFDLSAQAIEAARNAGITIAEHAADAVRDAEFVITMLPAGAHVLRVYNDLLPHAARNTVFIDSSTIDVASARAAHEQGGEAGMRTLDAPVSGGVGGAAAGTLTFMVGGDAQTFSSSQAIFQGMGKRIVHCGDAGAGQAAKICNNMILGVSMIAVSEAFVLGEKLGLSHQALYDVASTSSGQCWSLTTYCPVPGPVPASPANNAYKPGFATALMLKDLKLAQDAATAAGVDTTLGRHAAALYTSFSKAGGDVQDFSAIISDVRARSSTS